MLGGGTFKNGMFNFCLSVRFNATEAQLDQIRTAFQNGSQVLADATDAQHRFGTITIVNNSGGSQSGEYWVNSGTGRAYATLAKYGVLGQHVNLFFDSNFQAANGADGDAYTIAHEHAHHAYGLADEYSGPAGDAENAPFPDTPALNYSLMDNYFTRGGRAFGSGYTLNEFSVPGNHDPDGDTFQTAVNHQSDWETLAGQTRFPATAPVGLPMDEPTAAHTVTFNTGSGGLAAMVLLDRSGSMASEQRLDFAKSGGRVFTRFVRTGDSVGVASFSDFASVEFPLTPVVDDTTRIAANAAIDSLLAAGATNIGGGLLAALGQISARPQRSCNEIIVLLSDGDHNTGTPPLSVVPDLQDAGVTVLTVGVGSGISASGQATLQDVARQTGGKFFRVSNPFDLVGLFFRLGLESTGSGLLTRAPQSIASGQVVETPVLIEAGATRATFALTIADPTDTVNLSLRTPSGGVITQADTATNPNVTFVADENSATFEILGPEPGTWHTVVTAGAVTSGQVELLAFAAHEGVQLNVSVLKDTLVFPEPTVIQASPTFDGENVLGATVTGTVFRPSGPAVPVTLFDDGLASHGDTTADDGVYSASFNAYDGDGTYTFEVAAENSTGTTFGGESLFSSAPSNSRSVSPFVRRASATAVVTGVPAVVSPPTNLDLLATSDTGRFDDDNFTGDDTPTIRAEADPGLTVQFQVDGTTAASGAEVSPGIYEATLPATSLTLGENVITATAGASAPSQPLTFQLAELRRVVLRGSNPELVYAQPDGPQVTLRVAAARAEIDLLATDNVAEMVTTTVRGTGLRTTGPQSSYVVRGTAGVAYVPEIEISSQSFARISLFDVLLGDLSAPGDLTQLSVRGTESELAGSVQIGANLNSIRAAEATLTGEIHVGRNLGSSEFASAADGSRIDVGWTISRVRFVQDSTIDLHARIIDRLFADATLEGNIEAALRIATIDLAGESDLTVTSRRIGTIRSGGELGGSYTASVIDQMISDGPITAAFIGRPRIRIGKSRPATSDV